jgi:hypothetical protein
MRTTTWAMILALAAATVSASAPLQPGVWPSAPPWLPPRFLEDIYQKEWALLPRGSSSEAPEEPPEEPAEALEALEKALTTAVQQLGVASSERTGFLYMVKRAPELNASARSPVAALPNTVTTWPQAKAWCLHQQTGCSMILKPEMLPEGLRRALPRLADDAFRQALAATFRTAVTQHLYLSGPDAVALNPHTDGGDVFVRQLAGRKHWTVCVPPASSACPQCSSAELAVQHEFNLQRTQGRLRSCPWQPAASFCSLLRLGVGCTSYTKGQLAALACRNITLSAGDLLYLPRGVVHAAETDLNAGSSHMTYQLITKENSWLSRISTACPTVLPSPTCRTLARMLLQAPQAHVLLFLHSPLRAAEVRAMLNASIAGSLWSKPHSVDQLMRKITDASEPASPSPVREVRVAMSSWEPKGQRRVGTSGARSRMSVRLTKAPLAFPAATSSAGALPLPWLQV